MSEESAIVERRISYEKGALDETSAAADPFAQFSLWFDEAQACDEILEPNAMSVATADASGAPSLRVVLLRGVDPLGFVFFTNYESRKGHDLAANPHAALLFFWDRLERQIRIEGRVERVTSAESDAYFEKRPRGHRLSAWASAQSTTIPDRAYVETRMRSEDERFAGTDVPRPPYWGGYRVVPSAFEFWQGRRNRVHDRLVYERAGSGWEIRRLAP